MAPLLRRRVADLRRHLLAWAESWWNRRSGFAPRDRNQLIWRSLTEDALNVPRGGRPGAGGGGLARPDHGYRGPYWSRHYRFFRQGKALTVIREVFSPQLETWLGPTLRQEFQQNS